MRITTQQVQMQLKELKTTGKASPQLKSGDVLNGKIVEIQSKALLIALADGGFVRAEASDLERFSVDQQIIFQVEDVDEKLVQVAIVKGDENQPLTEIAKSQLQQIALDQTPENIKAYEVLVRLGIDVTKDNIQAMVRQFKQLSSLNAQMENIVKSSNINLSHQESNQIIQRLVTELGYESKEQMLESTLKDVVVKMLHHEQGEMVKQELPLKQQGETVKQELPVKTQGQYMDEKAQTMVKGPDQLPAESVRKALGIVREMVSQKIDLPETMDKLGQLMKLNKPVNLNNFSLLDKLSFDEHITKQVIALETTIESEVKSPRLLSLLRGLQLPQFETEDEVTKFFNQLQKELGDVQSQLSDKGKEQVSQLIKSLHFIQQDQELISWIQVPFQLNHQTRNLDIMIKPDKKDGRRNLREDANILISLDTNHLKRVQAYIQIKNKHLELKFRVADEGVKGLFEEKISALSGDLEESFDTVHIKIDVEKPMGFAEFIEDTAQGHINMKV